MRTVYWDIETRSAVEPARLRRPHLRDRSDDTAAVPGLCDR